MELLNREKCAELITDLGSRAASVQADIHVAGCSSIAHMRDHGDYRCALQLLNALPRGQRVQGLAEWFRAFTSKKFSVTYDAKERAWKGSLKKERAPEDFKVEEAMLVTFADFTKEKVARTMTVEKLLAYLTRVANNTDTVNGKPVVDEPTRALAARLHAAATA